jgi:hypothetical protein
LLIFNDLLYFERITANPKLILQTFFNFFFIVLFCHHSTCHPKNIFDYFLIVQSGFLGHFSALWFIFVFRYYCNIILTITFNLFCSPDYRKRCNPRTRKPSPPFCLFIVFKRGLIFGKIRLFCYFSQSKYKAENILLFLQI